MKRHLHLVLFAALAGPGSALSPAARGGEAPAYQNRIVARVEDRIITREQLLGDCRAFRPPSGTADVPAPEVLRQHLERMIDHILIVRDFERRKGKVPEFFVEEHYQKWIQSHCHGDRGRFAAHLQQHGKSVREFRGEIREEAIVHFMRQEQAPRFLSPAEIASYYEGHPKVFDQKAQLRLQQALLPLSGGEERGELRKKLAKLLPDWPAGRELAAQFPAWQRIFPTLRFQEPGWTTPDDLQSPLRKAVQGLGVGGHTPWLEIPNAFTLLYVADQRPAYHPSLPEVYGRLRQEWLEERQRENYGRWIQSLRQRAFLRIDL